MSMLKRPCGCGSGRLAQDCCGRFRRLSGAEVGAAYLSRQVRPARELLAGFAPAALDELQAEAATLPSRCDVFAEALRVMGARDTVSARVAVAKAIVVLREAGEIDEYLAAAAILELSSSRSPLCEAALAVARPPAPAAARVRRPATV